MRLRLRKPKTRLNLRQLPRTLEEDINRVFGRVIGRELLAYLEEIRYLFTKIDKETISFAESVESNIQFAYQYLTTSASNLSGATLNGITKTQCVLTTKSQSAVEFDWKDSLRTPRVIVGPGDGVEPHYFAYDLSPEWSGGVWGKSDDNVEMQRSGLISPYPDGTDLQLLFFKYQMVGSVLLPVPVDVGMDTYIYLEQRLPGEP